MLIKSLGRENIETLLRQSGHQQSEKAIPFLTTVEAFALKMPKNNDVRASFVRGSESEQAALLNKEQAKLGRDSVSITNLATVPRHIDTIEWFASPADINRLFAYFRRLNDPVVDKILAVNPIIPPGDAKRWDKFGGKGGSEPGVVSFAFMGNAKSGKIYSISGSWNNQAAPVDDKKFLSLMNRLLNIAAAK